MGTQIIPKCKIENCDGLGKLVRSKRHFYKGYCRSHLKNLNERGDPLEFSRLMQGQRKHELYGVWDSIKRRTMDEHEPSYRNYGGRGIKMCNRWQGAYGFFNFLEDMGPRPEGYTLERLDVNGHYRPDNCKWASWAEQGKNKRNSNPVVGVSYDRYNDNWKVSLTTGRSKYQANYPTEYEAISCRFFLESTYLA